ncbi:hypothetical protein H9Q69_007951 [Fusarium xylarioides]|nr:hypothetical protein H9Q70_004069 [Fusarium xylarioides]KAG5792982.1 hypothetical protein H9Q69_007951 [Fusarium xylarioides]
MASQDISAKMPSDLLSHLPDIPLDIILQHLDLASFTNLRLTSRQLSTNTISSRFFRCSKTDLSLDSLRSLRERATHLQLGPLLRELTVVATLYDPHPAEATVQTRKKWSEFDKNDLQHGRGNYRQRLENLRRRNVDCTDEELQEAQRDLDWIQTRVQLDTNTNVGQVTDLLSAVLKSATNLRAINLDACIIAGRAKTCRPAEHCEWYRSEEHVSNWPSVWTAASQTFRIVTSAISSSRIELESFHVFPNTPLCSVQLRHIEGHVKRLDLDGFAAACKNIKSLGLSFSLRKRIDGALPYQGGRLFRDAFGAHAPFQVFGSKAEDFTGATTILGCMTNITSLNFHLHHLDCPLLPEYAKVFSHISQNIRLGRLRELSLRGLPLRPDDITLFLTNHPTITKLSLEGILLVGRSWSSVFSCIKAMPTLESLYLSSLSTQNHRYGITSLDPVSRTVEFGPQNREQWVTWGDGHILHTLSMCREGIQQGLDFRSLPVPLTHCGKDMWAYMDRVECEFGPPSGIWEWDPLSDDM